MKKVLAYPKLLPTKRQVTRVPELTLLRKLYGKTHFKSHRQGRHMQCLFVRGSTASLLPSQGNLKMRTRMSDVDMVAITKDTSKIKSGYFITHRKLPRTNREVEIDILMINAQDIKKEHQSHYGLFFSTKLIQTSWLIDGFGVYKKYRLESLIFLIKKAYSRQQVHHFATPSQYAKWVIDEDLYGEPWRWTSFKTAFVTSPYKDRNRAQLIQDTKEALELLYKQKLAIKNNTKRSQEYSYQLNIAEDFHPFGLVNRTITILKFIFDQLILLIHYKNGFSIENGFRVLLKFKSLLQNPGFRFDSAIIFQRD